MYSPIGICSVFKWCISLKASLLLLCDLLPTNSRERVIYQPLLFRVRKRLMLYGSISIPVWHTEYNILPKQGGMSATWQSIISPSAPWQMHFSFFHQAMCKYCYIVKSFSLLLHKWLWKTWESNFCRVQNKLERVILAGRRRHCLQLQVPAGPTRPQAMQLCRRQHNRSTAGMRNPAQTHPCRLPGMCQNHADVPTDAPGFSFLPCTTAISCVTGTPQLTLSPWSSSIPSTD